MRYALALLLLASPAWAASDADLAGAVQLCTHHHVPIQAGTYEKGFEACAQAEATWYALDPARRNAASAAKAQDELGILNKALDQ